MRYLRRRRKRLQGAEALGLLKSGDQERPCPAIGSCAAAGSSHNSRSLIGRWIALIALGVRLPDFSKAAEGVGGNVRAIVVERRVSVGRTARVGAAACVRRW